MPANRPSLIVEDGSPLVIQLRPQAAMGAAAEGELSRGPTLAAPSGGKSSRISGRANEGA